MPISKNHLKFIFFICTLNFLIAAQAWAQIENIVVSNITSSSVTITWRTTEAFNGCVNYGLTTSLGSSECDSRPEGEIHVVNIGGLEPDTIYYFEVVSGPYTDNNGGAYYTFTIATAGIGTPYVIYGLALLWDGILPAVDKLAMIEVKSDSVTSYPLSTLTDSNGLWNLNLGNLKNPVTDDVFAYETGDSIFIRIEANSNNGIGYDTVLISGSSPQNTGTIVLVRDNLPSGLFDLISPPDDTTLTISLPTFVWHKSVDPDSGDWAVYILYWSTDSTYSVYDSIADLSDTSYTLTSGLVLEEIPDESFVYWKVKAVDRLAAETWCTPEEGWSFFVDTPDLGAIAGLALDEESAPIEDVHVIALGTDNNDSTDISGEYILDSLDVDVYDIFFSHPDYRDTTIIDVAVTEYDTTTLNVIMIRLPGFIDGVVSDEMSAAPIEDVYVIAMSALTDDSTDFNGVYTLDSLESGTYDIAFSHPDYRDTIITGIIVTPGDTTTLDVVMEELPGFIMGVVSDDSLNPLADVYITAVGTSVDDTSNINGEYVLNNLEADTYDIAFSLPDYIDTVVTGVEVTPGDTITLDVIMQEIQGYAYLPGDVNMYNGSWPPAVIGGDVTYLVNYFRNMPTSQPCLLDGFWCSADANGDCNIIGSDVTKMVNYFRGIGSVLYCPDYEPLWLTSGDLPGEAPDGWPNCDMPPVTGKVLPSGSGK